MAEPKNRVCSNCGHTWPWQIRLLRCPICNTKIKYGACYKCGEYTDWYDSDHWCRKCHNEAHNAYHRRQVAGVNKMLDDWLQEIKQIPTPYNILTEDQWLSACQYFGGCAFCGSEHIDARGMFIQFKLGGRYCDWNMIPLCERCNDVLKTFRKNPFRATVPRHVYGNQYVLSRFPKIVEYLQERLENAIRTKDM